MILRPLPHYQCSFKFSTVGAWQHSEVAGRTGDFGNWIEIWFISRGFGQSPLLPSIYYIMTVWPEWTVSSNGEFST